MKNLTGLCLLMLVALFSGCAKTANDIAEIKAEHQKSIAALNARVDKLASESIALRAEMAAKNDAAALELKKNLDGVSAAISQFDFQGLKSWRETGVLKANTLSLTSTILDDKHSLFLTAQSLIFMDGPNTVAMLSGGKFELTGDDSSSITLKSRANPIYLSLMVNPIMSGFDVLGRNGAKIMAGIGHKEGKDTPTLFLAAPNSEQKKPEDVNSFFVILNEESAAMNLLHSGSAIASSADKNGSETSYHFEPTGSTVAINNNKNSAAFISKNENQSKDITSVFFGLIPNKKGDGYKAQGNIADMQHGLDATLNFSAYGLNLSKGDREIVDLSLGKRGAYLKFFDEAGDKAPITLTLDDDGMPYIFTAFGGKYEALSPKFPRR